MPERGSENPLGEGQLTALQHSRVVSQRLSVVARRLRFSTSGRSGLFKAVGLRPRSIDKVFFWLSTCAVLVLFVVPVLLAIVYYGFLAADQFESETRFTVRSSTPALGKDQLGKATGLPAAKIIQDTQIIADFINSKAMLHELEEKVSFRKVYGDADVDYWARLDDDATSEEALKYWRRMVSISISPSSGIVTVKVRAFSPGDAQNILRQVVARAEVVVNDINSRIWKDVTATAQANFDYAVSNLKEAREQLQVAQDKTGVLSVEGTSAVINSLITTTERQVLELEQKYDTQRAFVSKNAPHLLVLQREIKSKREQLADLNQQLAGGNAGGNNLANVSVAIAQRQLEQSLAEQQFSQSVKTLEQIRFASRQQLLYLDAFLAPEKPDSAEYPKRLLWMVAVFFAAATVCVGVLALLSSLHKRYG